MTEDKNWNEVFFTREIIEALVDKSPAGAISFAECFGDSIHFMAQLIYQIRLGGFVEEAVAIVRAAQEEYPGYPFDIVHALAVADEQALAHGASLPVIAEIERDRIRRLISDHTELLGYRKDEEDRLEGIFQDPVGGLFKVDDLVVKLDGSGGGRVPSRGWTFMTNRIGLSVINSRGGYLHGKQEEFRPMTAAERDTFYQELLAKDE